MRLGNHRGALLVLLVSLGAVTCPLAQSAEESAHQAYRVERQKAVELFRQGKRLEALPLLERLVVSDSKDDTVLVDLAA